MVQPGDILLIDARGDTESCGSGAGSLMPPISRGLAGVVIDGAWRDITELQAIDFPIYGKGISAFSPPKGRPGEINVPVCCGGVIVHPGDIVVCDQEGGVIIPHKYSEIVANSLEKYSPRNSITDWDLERIQNNALERDKYFEEVFKMRGGEYED
jgi:regulator of RNase E activity RraA